ncbi:MAG: DUF4091 domain-containing protein [Gammaproteobacteria bacterium]|nr:DUF4091 domain-containing protein [Gammaproteobacteria bacterium]
MQKLLSVLLVVAGLAFVAIPFFLESLDSDACREINPQIAICAASDMAKLPNHGAVPLEHPSLAIAKGPLRLNAARNETVAFQLIVQNRKQDQPESLTLDFSALESSSGVLAAERSIRFFQSWYHYVDKGGYEWGPPSRVLKWPEYYPDALVPQQMACGANEKPVFRSIRVPEAHKGLQSVWVDIYVPADQPAGDYSGTVTATLASGERLEIPLQLQVWPAVLPDKPSFDAVGEVYRAYKLEGAGVDMSKTAWRDMSHCYQQLAHQHRMVFIERSPILNEGDDWSVYDEIFDPVLNGSLFSEQYGYSGPGENTPVTVWRTPWPQDYDVRLEAPLETAQLRHYQTLAREWTEHAAEKGWRATDFFAYIFDEIDGPDDDEVSVKRHNYLAMAHGEMKKVQLALDAGSGDRSIDLIWTSHSDPFQWSGIEELDLSGTIRLWVPNAAAASPAFLARRRELGEKIWFYHNGHPAVGVHSINASGIEMRTWGVIAARYNFDGQLMWAVNLGSDEQPFARPSYKDDDDRFGNGVMVYPGNQLAKIGFPATPGPMPSMRLKAWRRGLQDAELAVLGRKAGRQTAVDELLEAMIPAALGEATGDAQWPDDPARWIDFHWQLLELASGSAN